jgi:hypothetical protein
LPNTRGVDWIELVIQLVLAAIGVTIAGEAYGRRRSERAVEGAHPQRVAAGERAPSVRRAGHMRVILTR